MPPRRIRIAFLAQYLSIGGIETRLLKLLRALDPERYAPVVLCAADDGLLADEVRALGVSILVTPGLRPISRAVQALAVPRVLLAAGVARFDVVVSFLATSQPFEVWLARFGCRRGGFLYALMNRDRLGVERYWRQRQALAARIVAVSRRTAEFFHPPCDAAWAKLAVIPNGIDLRRFAPAAGAVAEGRAAFGLPAEGCLFVYPARIAPQKQHEVLLEVAERVARHPPGAHFVLAGQDKRDGWLQAEIARRGLARSVTWLGPVHDLERLLPLCDALLLTSAWEGCPNALLEGMACGLPAVVTRSGAEEFVAEGETGFCVEVGDAARCAEQVLSLAGDGERRRRMGRNARAWMERHGSLETMLARWFAEFDALAAGTPRPPTHAHAPSTRNDAHELPP